MLSSEDIEQGSLMLQGTIKGVTTKQGASGAHIRVAVDIPHRPGVADMLDNMSGKNIDVKISGPFLVAKKTEHPDQTHFGDEPPHVEPPDDN